MNKAEDYLDSLLNTVSPSKKIYEDDPFGDSGEKGYYDDFEKELNDSDMEDFIRDFELEIEEDKDDTTEEEYAGDSFFDNLEGIIKNAQKKSKPAKSTGRESLMAEPPDALAPSEEPLNEMEEENSEGFEVNTLEDDSWIGQESPADDAQNVEELNMEEPIAEDPVGLEGADIEESVPLGDTVKDDSDEKGLQELLDELQQDAELSNISQLLKAEKEDVAIDPDDGMEVSIDDSLLEAFEEEDVKGKKRKSKKDKKREKKKEREDDGESFLKKLSRIVFGDDEEDELEVGESVQIPATPSNQEGIDLENISEENLQILKELDNAEKASQAKPKDDDKEKKKKEKKEQKEKKAKEKKEKKEKKAKEKKEKKPKEKKEKKPKEIDLSPPLPKAPVILIFIMGISIVVLVMLSSNFLGYSMNIRLAKQAYNQKDYVTGYEALSGLKIKESEADLYHQTDLLARVQEKYQASAGLIQAGQYNMALDSLICAYGRYQANYEEASEAGITSAYDELAAQIEEQLMSQFNMGKEQALELYGLDDRQEYTKQVYNIIKNLGLE